MPRLDFDPACCPAIIFSDHVIREAGTAKLTLIGVFNALVAQGFPFSSPNFNITVFIENLEGMLEKLQVALRIEEKSSGHVIGSIGAEIGSKKPFKRQDTLEIPFAIPSCQFPSDGLYQVVLLVNNETIAKRDLRIVSSSTI